MSVLWKQKSTVGYDYILTQLTNLDLEVFVLLMNSLCNFLHTVHGYFVIRAI